MACRVRVHSPSWLRKSWQEALTAIGHIATTARKQKP